MPWLLRQILIILLLLHSSVIQLAFDVLLIIAERVEKPNRFSHVLSLARTRSRRWQSHALTWLLLLLLQVRVVLVLATAVLNTHI